MGSIVVGWCDVGQADGRAVGAGTTTTRSSRAQFIRLRSQKISGGARWSVNYLVGCFQQQLHTVFVYK